MQRAPDLPAVEYAERSDPGRDPEKQANEDACGYRQTRFGHLCVVCDGMGGHAAGREAAELALATIFEAFERASDDSPPAQVLRSAIEEASERVHFMRTSEVAAGRPGSTVVAVLLHPHGTEIAHVGDSRAYLVHEGQIFRLTRDHSIVQELVDRGLLTPQQASHHPEANRITRALGMAPDVNVELRPQPVHQVTGDAFVLCTDGLNDLVEDFEILAIVGGEPAGQAVGRLVDLANARGGHDNITVVVLRSREAAVAPETSVKPTLAQTSTTQTAGSAAPLTMNQAPVALARPLEPTPPPRSTRPVRPRRRPGALLILGLVLAAGAAVLLFGVLFAEFAERRGKRNATTGPSALDLPPSDAASGAPTALTPGTVVLPTASAPAEPLVPLEPSPASTPKRKR